MFYGHEILACAALLLAITMFDRVPREMRRSLFVVITTTGSLAAAAANAPAIAALTSLFG